jgi:hypothetical protein
MHMGFGWSPMGACKAQHLQSEFQGCMQGARLASTVHTFKSTAALN